MSLRRRSSANSARSRLSTELGSILPYLARISADSALRVFAQHAVSSIARAYLGTMTGFSRANESARRTCGSSPPIADARHRAGR